MCIYLEFHNWSVFVTSGRKNSFFFGPSPSKIRDKTQFSLNQGKFENLSNWKTRFSVLLIHFGNASIPTKKYPKRTPFSDIFHWLLSFPAFCGIPFAWMRNSRCLPWAEKCCCTHLVVSSIHRKQYLLNFMSMNAKCMQNYTKSVGTMCEHCEVCTCVCVWCSSTSFNSMCNIIIWFVWLHYRFVRRNVLNALS